MDINEYFGGKVASLGFENQGGRQSVGVMEPGEYTFNTAVDEVMLVMSGEMTVKREADAEAITYGPGERFDVPAEQAFQVQVSQSTAYLCGYADA